MKKPYAILIITVVSMLIALGGLHTMEFMRINTRFALFVTELSQYGTGVFPTIYGKPYADYPVTMIYLMYLASCCGKYLNMLTAVIPTAVAGVVVLIFTYLLGERMRRHLGLYGVGLCLLSFEFLNIIRNPGLDMFVAAATVIAVYLAYGEMRGDGWKRLLWLPPVLIVSYAFRGPLGIVIPTAAVVALHLSRFDWKRTLLWGVICGAVGIVCVAVTIWLCLKTGGKGLVEIFIFDQVIGRMEKSQAFWYYFTNAVGSYALTYPLALVVAVFYGRKVFVRPHAADSDDLIALRMLVFWALIILIGMSIPGSKHLRYIVAAIPAMGLIAAWIFVNPDKLIAFELLQRIFFLIARYLPFAGFAGILITGVILELVGVDLGLPVILPAMLLLLLCGMVLYCRKYTSGDTKSLLFLMVAIGCMAVVKIMVVEPVENFRETSRAFAERVDLFRGDKEVWFFSLGPDSDEFKYLVNISPERRFIGKYVYAGEDAVSKPLPEKSMVEVKKSRKEQLMDKLLAMFPDDQPGKFSAVRPIFKYVGGYQTMMSSPEGTIFLSRKKRFDSIPEGYRARLEVVLSGRLGHQECVAFRVKTKK